MTKASRAFFQWFLFLVLAATAPFVSAQNDDNRPDPFLYFNSPNASNCLLLSLEATTQVVFSQHMRCITVPTLTPSHSNANNNTSSSSESGSEPSIVVVRLSIVPDMLGRYEVMHQDPESDYAVGYAWTNPPSEGLYYCVASGTVIVFGVFVEGSTISIQVEPIDIIGGEICDSHPMGYDNYSGYLADTEEEDEDVDEPKPGGVVWSSNRYLLRADRFAFTVDGDLITLEDAENIEVTGDPGGDDYMSIEITWFRNGKEKRFYGYLESDGAVWRMYEARVYDANEEWVTFFLSYEIQGIRDDCFQQDEITLMTRTVEGNPATIVFQNLTLAVFLPWSDQDAMDACIIPYDQQQQHMQQEADDASPSSAVLWSSARYFLQASHFEYTIVGQDTASMAGSRNIVIDGDPGSDEYMSIEIEWLSGSDTTALPKRFFAYFAANATHWNMFEARVRDIETDRWESFEDLVSVLSGPRGSCFTSKTLVIKNDRGSDILFENLVLAVFLPWDDDNSNHAANQTEQALLPQVLEARSAAFGGLDLDASCQVLLHDRPIISVSSEQSEGSAAVGVGDDDTVLVTENDSNVVVEDEDQDKDGDVSELLSSAVASHVVTSYCICFGSLMMACLTMFEA